MAATRVVNIKSGAAYDVYIGRGKCPRTGKTGRWGNQFEIGSEYNGRILSRRTCIDTYRDWLENSEEGFILLGDIWTLYGKTLGCWCAPESCHGEVLADIAEQHPPIVDFHRHGHEFLSNFSGGAFSLEHDFQAAKAGNEIDKMFVITAPNPGEAKRRGRMIKARPDWESEKMDVMMRLLEEKFGNPIMADRLLGTGYSELVEGNYWCDNTWGVCGRGQPCRRGIHSGTEGENILGQMLMDIRRRLRLNGKLS